MTPKMTLSLVQCGGSAGTAVHRCCYSNGQELKPDDKSLVVKNDSMSWCQPSVAWLSTYPGRSFEDVWADCYKDQYAYIQKNGARKRNGEAQPGTTDGQLPPNGSYYCVAMWEQIRADAPRRASWPGFLALVGVTAVAVLACV